MAAKWPRFLAGSEMEPPKRFGLTDALRVGSFLWGWGYERGAPDSPPIMSSHHVRHASGNWIEG